MSRILVAGLTFSLLAMAPGGSVVQLTPSKDNTLFEPDGAGERSSGVGPQFFAGRIGGFGGGDGLRRGLLAFDVASSIPGGSTIDSVTLTVYCSRVPLLDNGTPRLHKLQRASSDWGEGTSDAGINGGAGAPPTAGDATWSHTFFPGSFWGSAGGDFSATISASVPVPTSGSYTFASSAQLVADVQDMLDNPATDFGWVVTGNEIADGVARAFDTGEAPTYPNYGGTAPVLEVSYTGPGIPAVDRRGALVLALLLLGSGAVFLARRSAA